MIGKASRGHEPAGCDTGLISPCTEGVGVVGDQQMIAPVVEVLVPLELLKAMARGPGQLA